MQKTLGLKGRFGRWAAKKVLHILDIDRVNDIQSRYPQLKGPDFSEKVLEEVGVRYDIPAEDLKNIPAEGGFITIPEPVQKRSNPFT